MPIWLSVSEVLVKILSAVPSYKSNGEHIWGRGSHNCSFQNFSQAPCLFCIGVPSGGGGGGGGYFELFMRVGVAKKLNWTHHLFDDALLIIMI